MITRNDDPPDELPDPPECCGEFMEIRDNPTRWVCPICAGDRAPEPDPGPEPDIDLPAEEDMVADLPAQVCPHGADPAGCNDCAIASDRAYDAQREQRL